MLFVSDNGEGCNKYDQPANLYNVTFTNLLSSGEGYTLQVTYRLTIVNNY